MAAGAVQELVVENFKSYEGRVRIGPLQKLTCIVGQNGAGKSNVLDAIAFVLCVQRRRTERLVDLVHRKEGEAPSQVFRAASVELVYTRHEDGPEGGFPAVSRTIFRRVIQPLSQSLVQVDGQTVSLDDYLRCLKEIHVLSQARNFFVYQGDVDAVARRQGRDLTNFFEQVSGSVAFREEYERLATERAQREEAARLFFHKKRCAANVKKDLAQQKAEADRYHVVEAERRRLHTEFYLFRLSGIEQRKEATRNLLAEAEGVRASIGARAAELEEQLKAADQDRARARQAAQAAARATAAARSRLERLNPELVATRSRIQVLEERLVDFSQHSEEEVRRQRELEAQVTALKSERQRLEKDIEQHGKAAREEFPFTPEQRQEFERAKREALRLTTATAAQTRDLEGQFRVTERGRLRAEREIQEATTLCGHLQRKVQDLDAAMGKAKEALERDIALGEERSKKLAVLQQAVTLHADESNALLAERQLLLQGIRDITAMERHIQRERALAQASADLTRLFPGVWGRVLELCTPASGHFKVALNTALGGYVDAVVTDTADSARQCVLYLKDHMMDPMTFLPMDNLRGLHVNPALQEALRDSASVKPALSCTSFDPMVRRAFEFILGDVVFADSLPNGKHFVYHVARSHGASCRVVTLDGMTISRDGNLAVSSEGTREGSTRFDFAELEAQRQRLDVIDRRVCQLHRLEAEGGADREAHRQDVAALELRVQDSRQTFERLQAEHAVRTEDLKRAEATLAALQPEAKRLMEDEARIGGELRALEASISQLVSQHFQQLNAAMGEEDIFRREREWRQAKESAQLQVRELSHQLGSVRAEIAMVDQTLLERAARAAALGGGTDWEDELARMRARCATLEGEVGQVASEAEGLDGREAELLEAERSAERALAQQRQELRQECQRLAVMETKASGFAADLQALEVLKSDLLKQSLVEEVEVPQVSGSQDVDFTPLPEDKQARAVGDDAKAVEEEYRFQLQGLSEEFEKLRPNLRAVEQLSSVEDDARRSAREASEAHRAVEEARQNFEEVRQERRRVFMECFKQVSAEICNIYRKLTGTVSSGFADGGAAYLDLEELEDPFSGGVRFTAMPPTKRFSDISLLSGGERALASLALLFAVQVYQKPPFLVLDEVDAHLDAAGVRGLAAYAVESKCQMLVISLRHGFYSRSEALVGVSKDKRKESSVIFTWDLAQFRKPSFPVLAPPSSHEPLQAAEDVEMATA